jgi:hypothetical protein
VKEGKSFCAQASDVWDKFSKCAPHVLHSQRKYAGKVFFLISLLPSPGFCLISLLHFHFPQRMRITLLILAALAVVTAFPVPERKVVDVEDESDLDWRFEDEDVEMFSVEYLKSFDQPSLKVKVQDYEYNWNDDEEFNNDREEYVKIARKIMNEVDDDDLAFWSPESDTSLMNDDDLDFANDDNIIALLLSSADPDYNLIEAAIIMRKEVNRADKQRLWQQNQRSLEEDDIYQDIHSDT